LRDRRKGGIVAGIAVDWATLASGLKDEALAAFKGYIEGAEEDLQAYGGAIATDALRAAREGREDLFQELREQAKVLAEIHRIRLSGLTWDQVGNVLAALGKIALKAIAVATVAL
jgi:hypothetical protein